MPTCMIFGNADFSSVEIRSGSRQNSPTLSGNRAFCLERFLKSYRLADNIKKYEFNR